MIIEGKRPLAGLSNQNPAGLQDFLLEWYASDAATKITTAGILMPVSGSLQHSADLKVIRDVRGDEVTVIHTNEKIICEFMCVPLVAAGGTLTDLLISAKIPPPGAYLDISQAPALTVGSFADCLNSNAWMYNDDGRIELASDGEWGIRFSGTLRSSLGRVAAVAI
jgi:hypothetical protein